MILGATTLWGVSATVARIAFRDHGVPPLTMVEMRLAIACGLMLPWLVARPASFRVPRRDWRYLATLGLLGVAAVQGTYYYSISRLGVGPAILLQYLAPALLVAFEIVRGRPPEPRTVAAVLVAIAGTALLVSGPPPEATHPTVLDWVIGLCSSFSFGFYIGFSKRGLASYPSSTILFYSFLVAAAFWGAVTPPWRIAAAHYSPAVWLLFLLVGIGSTLVPFSLFAGGLRRLPPVETAVLATFEPVVAVGLAAAVLHETLGIQQWIGALLVIGGALLASLPKAEDAATSAERV